jgi:hypothetical protein
MTRGKNINLFLIDGNPDGRIKCSIANWTGVIYKIPRIKIKESKDRKDLSQSGVYFLFSSSEENEEDIVYIGQAGSRKNGEGLLNRILEHIRNPEKDFWTDAVIVTTSNNSFGPTEISYLENRFYKLALEANRYKIKNNVDPTSGNITEEKESELEEFIDYAKIIIGVLGYKIFIPIINESDSNNEENIFFLNRKTRSGEYLEAKCLRTNEGFVVLKGSKIRMKYTKYFPPKLIEKRKSTNIDENGILKEDVLFKSPSYAAAFITGNRENGLIVWKNKDGIPLKNLDL